MLSIVRVLGTIYVLCAATAAAQPCPPVHPNQGSGAKPDTPWFDFQVGSPAVFIEPAGGASMPYPDQTLARVRTDTAGFALVQFVVDTLGRPIATTLKFLRAPAELDKATVIDAAARWRYRAAKAEGCVIKQLVQTPLRWK